MAFDIAKSVGDAKIHTVCVHSGDWSAWTWRRGDKQCGCATSSLSVSWVESSETENFKLYFSDPPSLMNFFPGVTMIDI